MKKPVKTEIPVHSFVKPKLTVEECRPILCSSGEKYTDEEIKEIIEFILTMVEIDYLYYQRQRSQLATPKMIDLFEKHEQTEEQAA